MPKIDTRPLPAIRPGDVWACVTPKGRGQPVRIKSVTPLSIQFRPQGRHADASRTFSLPTDLFRLRYCPMHQVEERQQQLQEQERREGLPQLIDPVIDPEEDLEARRPARSRRPGGKEPKFTASQAREIYRLSLESGADLSEIAQAYECQVKVIRDIQRGRTYKWATLDLLEANVRDQITAAPESPSSSQEKSVSVLDTLTSVGSTDGDTVWKILTDAEQQLNQPKTSLEERHADAKLLTDLSAAIDTLMGYAGSELPKFITLDYQGLSELLERSRQRAEELSS